MWRAWYNRLFAQKSSAVRTPIKPRITVEQLEDRLVPAHGFTRPLFDFIPVNQPPSEVKVSALGANVKAGKSILQEVVPQDNTTLVLRFTKKLGKGKVLLDTYRIPGLTVLNVQVGQDLRTVTLTTTPRTATTYLISFHKLYTRAGDLVKGTPNTITFSGTPTSTAPPRVVGANSTGNRSILLSYSEAMADNVLVAQHYSVFQDTVNPEAGTLKVLSIRFTDDTRRTVELTTDSQNELTYTVAVVNVTDMAGTPLAPATVAGSIRIDPSRAGFHGTPPTGSDLTDTDGDGLMDNEEQRGYTLSFKLINGTVVTRGVTSDPRNPDSDGDGLSDGLEAALRLDPRDGDTDDDLLSDNQEYNEIYSDATNQDSDGDGLDDGLEFNFFRTSPTLADTDGDQLLDGQEVLLANRNARVADLPAPAIEIGNVNLQLDVRFTETTTTQTRELESRSVSSSLTQSDKQEQSNSNSATIEAYQKLTVETGFEVSTGVGLGDSLVNGKFSASSTVETGASGSWTGSWSDTTSNETIRAYQDSLETQAERTEGATLERQVNGARMQVTVSLKNTGTLAYRVKNLQVTVFIQDPQNPTGLTPIATLLPDSEPGTGFTLGPLVPERGPFVFSSDTVFPALIENLMANPRGLVFRLSNYDIVDEFDRNFAFTSRDIIDRTGSVVIDFGGYDTNGDGEGDLTEYHRVATGAGRVIDTNGDGTIDANDHRIVFDANGNQVGITLREALTAMGLTHYDELTTPTASLTEAERVNSYSTIITAEGAERIFRIRNTAREEGVRKSWEIITPTGIDRTVGLDDFIVGTNSDVKLAFVQDIDEDGLPATLEFLYGTSDELADTDSDGLDDRFETLIGWTVEVAGRGTYHVTSSGTLADTDGDGLSDFEEAPGTPTDTNGDGKIDTSRRAGPDDFVTDPLRPDTDRDGIDDFTELDGYQITLRGTTTIIDVMTDPANPDTDGDTASDGIEKLLGGNPTDPSDFNLFTDSDGDGLANVQETDGWFITVYDVSTVGRVQGTAHVMLVTSNPLKADTDGDGLFDGAESRLLTNPRLADTDNDGLTDIQEVLGIQVRDLGVITLDPNDADSDNDRLSDGQEVEFTDIEANRWIVRVHGAAPYRVFSDPRFADADFDHLVDGDERLQGSDPTNANTDGNSRNDDAEFSANTNPLREDLHVTVLWEYLHIEHDADRNEGIIVLDPNDPFADPVFVDQPNAGDFRFDFSVRKPDDTSLSGLGVREPTVTDATVEAFLPEGNRIGNPGDDADTEFLRRNPDQPGIGIHGGNTLSLPNYMPTNAHSTSFGLAKDQRFTLEARISEVDYTDDGTRITRTVFVDLGGLSGIRPTVNGVSQRALWEGSTLTPGLYEVSFEFNDGDTRGQVDDDNEIEGELRAYLFVS